MSDKRATGRRVGRMEGVVDDLGLKLAGLRAAEVITGHPDQTVLDHLSDADDLVGNLAGCLGDLATHLNQRDRTLRPGA